MLIVGGPATRRRKANPGPEADSGHLHPLAETDLPLRVVNQLSEIAGINYIEELIKFSDEELMKIPVVRGAGTMKLLWTLKSSHSGLSSD